MLIFAASKRPTLPGNNNNNNNSKIVCPAGRDNLHWWQIAEQLIQRINPSQDLETSAKNALQAAQVQKRRCQSAHHHPIGILYATSGLRTTSMHRLLLDWALIKLDDRFSVEKLQNVSVFFKFFLFLSFFFLLTSYLTDSS